MLRRTPRRRCKGRPRSVKPRRSHHIRWTDEEWARVQAAASQKGISSSELIRQIVLDKIRRTR